MCVCVCVCMYCSRIELLQARLDFKALSQLNQYRVLHLDRNCSFCITEIKLMNTTFRINATYIGTSEPNLPGIRPSYPVKSAPA